MARISDPRAVIASAVRRGVIVAALLGAACLRPAPPPLPDPGPTGETVRDRLWLWDSEAGSYDNDYGLTAPSRMTQAEGMLYFGVRNFIQVREHGKPAAPYDQYAIALRPVRRLVWSVVGASGKT